MPELDAEKAEEARLAQEHADAEAKAAEELDAELDAEFDAGFKGTVTAPDADSTPKTVPNTATEETAPTKIVEPELATLTKEQLTNLIANQNLVAEIKGSMEKQFGSAFGKMGGLERTLKELQNSTVASTEPITLSKADFKELSDAGFEDLSEKLIPVLTRVMSRVKVKGAPSQTFDLSEVTKAVDQRLTETQPEREKAQAFKTIEEFYPDWREIVGDPNAPVKSPWRAWVQTQPAAYQKQVLETWNPLVVARSIDKFTDYNERLAAQPKAKTAVDTRKERLSEAVTKKSSAARETVLSDDEQFDLGFKTGNT